MKRFLNVCITLTMLSLVVQGQNCVANYTYSALAETYSFINTSTVSNVHYYWSFGDGDGSNLVSPVHSFPDAGKYLVTLFCHDTISNCSNYMEQTITVSKPDTIPCLLFFTDTLIGASYTKNILTTGCNPFYQIDSDEGPCGSQVHCWFGGGWQSALFISKITASHNFSATINGDTGNLNMVYKEYFKTVKFNYSPAINYQNCSANFEVNINYQANGAMINFAAMNRNATSYEWIITGLGFPIFVTTPTMSYLYPYPQIYGKSQHYTVVLHTYDIVNNCSDTVTQDVLIKNPNHMIYTGIKEFNKLEFSVFPNPAKDNLYLEFDQNITLNKITILNTLGQEVYKLLKPQPKQEIDVSHLPEGIYFLKAESPQGQAVFKILKE